MIKPSRNINRGWIDELFLPNRRYEVISIKKCRIDRRMQSPHERTSYRRRKVTADNPSESALATIANGSTATESMAGDRVSTVRRLRYQRRAKGCIKACVETDGARAMSNEATPEPDC
jgi:hypothetical protein